MVASLDDGRVHRIAHTVDFILSSLHEGDADGVNTGGDACQQVEDENDQEHLDESQTA